MMTPYAAAKRVNVRLLDEEIDKVIPPQMMYNYTKARVKKGLKPFIKYTDENGIDTQSFEEWLDKYIAKQKALASIEN